MRNIVYTTSPFESCTFLFCKHVVAKVTLVPCSVNLTGKRDKVGHGKVTINNARIILLPKDQTIRFYLRRRVRNCLHVCNVKIDVNYGVSYLNMNVKVLFGRVHNFFKLLTKCHCMSCT